MLRRIRLRCPALRVRGTDGPAAGRTRDRMTPPHLSSIRRWRARPPLVELSRNAAYKIHPCRRCRCSTRSATGSWVLTARPPNWSPRPSTCSRRRDRRSGGPWFDRVRGSARYNTKDCDPDRPDAQRCGSCSSSTPERKAVLLVAGDKSGRWKDCYRTNIPVAEARYDQWLAGDRAEEV